MTQLVIVESPAKAKTIQKYLGNQYHVLASMGHIRDLPSKSGSVDPEQNFLMHWESNPRAAKNIQAIVKAAKESDAILLATDPDREGEAISWHILETLREKKALKQQHIARVVFHEITTKAVKDAVAHPRTIDPHLVDAYLARRALDYLVGFTLSPVLWRKLPGSRSAGRVQSVALRLICDREAEIEKFISQEYWHIEGRFTNDAKKSFTAKLVTFQGKKLDKFALANKVAVDQALHILNQQAYSIAKVEKKQVQRNPYAPFTTSTLQQEAARKLGFGAKTTMRLAQELYEGVAIHGEVTGLITYMRTDSVNVSQDAIQTARSVIESRYGKDYVPAQPRHYSTKTKNAQEAHEAIRPTSLERSPESLQGVLDRDLFRLYELIWQRMLASQMTNALYDQVSADILSADHQHTFRAVGTTLTFDGFRRIYDEGKDDDADSESDDDEKRLPPLEQGQHCRDPELSGEQHFTQPPPRFSEATLVKKLEELGIGRPSTYASIISTLIDRQYARIEKKQFHPESRGRIVTTFLKFFFSKYVEYDFTAQLENQLDDVSRGEVSWLSILNQFWGEFKTKIDETSPLKTSVVLDTINEELGVFLFGEDQKRLCPQCGETDHGTLSLKLGKFGAFIGCSRYPECNYTRQLTTADTDEDSKANEAAASVEARIVGKDPQSGCDITLKKGPYGFYFQWEDTQVKGKPKRVGLPKSYNPQDASLEQALALSQLPKTLGQSDQGEAVSVGIGRFGPFIKIGSRFVSIPKNYDILTISLDEAMEVVRSKPENPAKPKVSRWRKKGS